MRFELASAQARNFGCLLFGCPLPALDLSKLENFKLGGSKERKVFITS